jgi:hypothetical protein
MSKRFGGSKIGKPVPYDWTQLRDIKAGLLILMLMNLAFFAVHVIVGVGCR